MHKKVILVLAGIFLFFGCNIAKADVVINEVQINPIEDRFIELYNSGNSAVDLTGWYIQRRTENSDTFSSLVTKTNFQNKTIGSGKYLLISKGRANADIVLDSFSLTESNIIQIKNSNGGVVDKVCWGDINDCGDSKTSNPAEGQSIQRNQNGLWTIGAILTPGAQNYTSSNDTNTATQDSGNDSDNPGVFVAGSSSQNTAETKTKITEVPKIKTEITAHMIAFVGMPTDFSANATGYSNEQLFSGKYFWNFGDGDSKEIRVSDAAKFTHTFYYAGEYNVLLEYYQNYYSQNPDASDSVTVRVVPADISISNVGDENDFFVEIYNNTDYSADLSRWSLVSGGKSFTLPQNTILESKKKIILSPKITGFSVLDKDTLKLVNAEGKTVFNYLPPVLPAKILVKNIAPVKISIVEPDVNTTEIPVSNLVAEAVKSNPNTNNTNTKNNFIYEIGLLIFLGVSASAAYFIRSRNRRVVPKGAGDDFEIIDE